MEKLIMYFQPGAQSGFGMGPCVDLIWIVKLTGLIAIFRIFFLKRYRKPMGSAYWLAALTPSVVGAAAGSYMQNVFVVDIAYRGYVGPTPPEFYTIRAVFVMHYGLFLSCLLATVILYFYARDWIVGKVRRLPNGIHAPR